MKALDAYLVALQQSQFQGDICQDIATRAVMATDNSVYKRMPQAVLYPKDHNDVVIIFQLAAKDCFQSVTFSARGGGTGTNGQSLTTGIMIVFTKYMDNILHLDLDEKSVTIQPGVVLDQLNDYLKPYGYFFSPTVSPSNRATLGGMLSTDASGQGSCIYGKTSQHIVALKHVTVTGKTFCSRKMKIEKITNKIALHFSQSLINICLRYKDEVANRFPKLLRYMTGYDLAHVYQGGHVDLSRIISGSEGTLTTVTELTLNLTLLPKHKLLFVLRHQSFEEALSAAEWINDQKPSAVEVVDETVMQLAQTDKYFYSVSAMVLSDDAQLPGAISLVEFIANDDIALSTIKNRLEKRLIKQQKYSRFGFFVTEDKSEMQTLWQLRKRSVELIGKLPALRKPVSGIEDTVVDPKHLKSYILSLRNLLDKYDLKYAMYGHIDAGCIHVRPALDLTKPADEHIYHELSNEVANLVQSYGGLIWGEHGKGMRSGYIKQFMGATLYHAFREIKTLFDPFNQLNPGKIATPLESQANLLSISAPKKAHDIKKVSLEDKHKYSRSFLCNGNAACLQYDFNALICPSYKVTKDPIHSPKGRVSILNEWLFQKTIQPSERNMKVEHESLLAFEGCLGCSACITQCPVSVNIPHLKSMFYEAYFSKHKRTLKHYLIAYAEFIHPYFARFPKLSHVLSELSLSKWLLKKVGFCHLPLYAKTTWHNMKRKAQLKVVKIDQLNASEVSTYQVVILVDWLSECYMPDLLLSTYQLMQALGFKVAFVEGISNGKAFYNLGMRDKLKLLVDINIKKLQKLQSNETAIIGIDPSLSLFYQDEYREFCVKKQTLKIFLLQEILTMPIFMNALNSYQEKYLSTAPSKEQRYYLFSHCHESLAKQVEQNLWPEIFKQLNLSLQVVKVGCCGMAGSYGYETAHFDNSKKLFEMSWEKAMKQYNITQENMLVTGFSCREQVQRFAGFTPKHPVQILGQVLNVF